MRGKRVAQYEILDALGVGGMGTVYRARRTADVGGRAAGEQVALKVVHAQLLEQPGFFKRFLREAEVGKQVDHPNVVRTYDCDATVVDGRQQHYLVMELVEGQTLRGLADELGVVPEELCRHVAREVAQGLDAIHAAGVVHRDLKPENVLITQDHAVKVMDLGVAHLQDEVIRLSQTGAFIGSVEYAAPEQFRGRSEPVDGRADLHALGAVLYELSTGRHPFRADDTHETLRRVLEGDCRSAGAINPNLSSWFVALVHTLMAREPDERLPSARALADVLDQGERSTWWQERSRLLREEGGRSERRLRITRDTALYGRVDELGRLRRAYDHARDGHGQVVLVEGEAGIGKTRLVDAFVARLREEGEALHFLFGSYPPGGAATVAGAFSTAYREHFGVERIEEVLGPHLPDTPLLVPAFAALLRGDAPPAGREALTQDSLQTVFVHATRSLAAERPTIVLIDDLHFAPEAGRALFSALAASVLDHRVLLIGTMRRGIPESWVAGTTRLEHVTQISLPRLGPKDLARLLEEAFQSRRLAEDLNHLISMKSDGNPFFAFEIIQGLREGNFITQNADGTWVSTGEIRELQVPSSVLDLVDARVSDLTEEERDLVDVAACCGFEFDSCLVADALGLSRIPALKSFARIERRHRLIRATGALHEFDHHQVQEALYARLMPQLKAEYHAALGDALEARVSNGDGSTASAGWSCVELCEHHLRGSRPERALPHLEAALQHLAAGYVNDRAIRLADRALDVPRLLEGTSRVHALLTMCRRLDMLGRREEEEAAIREAHSLAIELGDVGLQIEVLRQLGGNERLRGALEASERTLGRAVELAHELGDEGLEAQALADLGNAQAARGRYVEAQATLERSLELDEDSVGETAVGSRLANLAAVLHMVGEVDRAQQLFRRHLDLAVANGDRQAEVLTRGNYGMVLAEAGRGEEAEAQYERALELAREIGDRIGEGHLESHLGNLAVGQGRLEVARTRFRRVLELSKETSSRMGEAMATGNLGNVCYALGRYGEALEYYERALELTQASGDRYIEVLIRSALGEVATWTGAFDEGRWQFEQALVLATESAIPAARAEVLVKAAQLEAFAAASVDPGPSVEEGVDLLEGLDNPELLADALIIRGRLRVDAGDGDDAREDFQRALEIARRIEHPGNEGRALGWLLTLGAADTAEAVRRVETGGARASVCARTEARWLLWSATKDPAHLREARSLVAHLVQHAPPGREQSLAERVPIHRAIVEAADAGA